MKLKNKIIFVGILVLIDQLIKIIVMNNLKITIELIPNFLSLNYLKNYGVGFSLLSGNRFLILLITAVLMYKIFSLLKDPTMQKYQVPLLLILAGGIGNLIDRIIHGFVVDYIDVLIFNYDFPVFNFADSILVIGAGIIMIQVVYEEMRKNE